MRQFLFNFIWLSLSILGGLLLVNGLIHLPFYLVDGESIFSGLRLLTVGLLMVGAMLLYVGLRKLDQPNKI